MNSSMEYKVDSDNQSNRAVLDLQHDIQLGMQNDLQYSDGRTSQSPKLIYFSDGVLAEDELNAQPAIMEEKMALVDPRSLTWAPWLWYRVAHSSARLLDACDYIGESLAYFFGITSPKYQYEIEEADRMKQEEQERLRREEVEMAGWNTGQSYVSLQRGFNDVNPPENLNAVVCLVPPAKTTQNNSTAVSL